MKFKIKNRPVTVSFGLIYRTILNLASLIFNTRILALPASLQIEPSNICNLKCKMCALNFMKRKRGIMKFSLFKKIMDEVKPTYLCLTGYTEAFMNKEIFKMINYAKKFSTVKIDTNATLLTEENIKKIIKSKLDILSISIDSLNKKTFEKIRKKANFEKVIKGIELLKFYRKKMKSDLQIHFAITLQKQNIRDLPDILKFAKKIDADYVGIPFMTNYGIKNKKYRSLQIGKQDLKNLKNVVAKSKAISRKLKLNINFKAIGLLLKYKANYKKICSTPCYFPWYGSYISFDGDVYSCCYAYDGQIKFGNLYKQSFKEIWFSKKYSDFRKTLRKGKFGFCNECTYNDLDIKEKLNKIPFIKMS